ncbi:MAG: hypothetical protein OET07_16245, partial [Desulfobacteraceae bacterium]|nr:hypothetical protein [Desulfobacteraceae bacterium]
MILRAFACIFTALLFFGVPGAFPQDAQPKEPSTETKAANEQPVLLGDKILFYLATEAEGRKLEKRAEVVSERIKKIADSPRFKVDSIRTRDLNEPITLIVTGNEILSAILDHDAVSKGKSRQQLATEYSQVIRTAIEKYREDRGLKQLIYSVFYTFLATFVLIAILTLIGKIKHKIDQRIEERFKVWEKGIQIKSVQIVGAEKINDLLKGSIKGIRLILVLVFIYIYLQLELGFFPWTRPFAGQVLSYVLSPLITIGKGFSKNIPNLIFIA